MTEAEVKTQKPSHVVARGGPHGLGRPEDKRLRQVERNIVIPNRLKEEATKKCANPVRKFLQCVEATGLLVVVKCREEHRLKDLCIAKWMNDESLQKEVTDKYLEERTYYRATGKPLNPKPLKREKMKMPDPIDDEE
ncbi:hypothetical protein RUM43_003495 [Polyplax serrata]|uniref:COX assembly mitochondrial protein n=1 Tax=Polyplax serrata TaxID=468196 RepID=A0AAN8S5K7_POLSC